MVATANQIHGGFKPWSLIIGKGGIPQPGCLQFRLHIGQQLVYWHGSQVMGVHAYCLGIGEKFRVVFTNIEHGVSPIDAFQGKRFYEFIFGKKFPVIRSGPPQQNEKVYQGPGQETPLAIVLYCNHFTMSPFGDFALFGIQGEGHVGEPGQHLSQGFVDQDLFGRVGQMVLTPDHVGDPIADVIHCIGEDVKRRAV